MEARGAARAERADARPRVADGAERRRPLRDDGSLALGTWQGIFLCEFDGPRERSVYVSVLRGGSLHSTLACGMAAPVRTGEELELQIDSLAYGGNGVGRLNGFVVFVRGALPATACARRSRRSSAGSPRPPRTVLEPSASDRRSVPALRRVRRLPVPEPRLRGAGRGEGAAGSRRARSHRPRRGAAARADRARGFALPLPEQARVLVHGDRGGGGAGIPPCGSLGRGHRDRRVPAHDRPRERDPRRRARLGARGAAPAYNQATGGATSATSSSARAGTRVRHWSCS